MDGNMTYRNYDGGTYIQKFDVENPVVATLNGTCRRLVAISAIADTQTLSVTQFLYPAKASGLRDGTGNRVKTTIVHKNIYPDDSWTAPIRGWDCASATATWADGDCIYELRAVGNSFFK
jgi:hypothetical protein